MKPIAYLLLVISICFAVQPCNARTRPHFGGTIKIETSGTAADSALARSLQFDTLTTVTATGKVEPTLAARWESQNGDRRWVFWLRPQVSFHDGTQLTSSTVAESLNAISGAPWQSVRTLGEQVIIEGDSPMASLPELLAADWFAIFKRGSNGEKIGTGPYSLTTSPISANVNAILTAFDECWRGRPFIDKIEIQGHRTPRDQSLDFSVGRADIVEIPADHLRKAQQDHLRTVITADADLVAVVFNPRVQNAELRQSLAEGVDRAALLNFIFQKQGAATAAMLPDSMTGYGALFPISQNLARARELRGRVRQTGPLVISYDTGDAALQLVAERIVLSAKDAGVSAQAIAGQPNVDVIVTRVPLRSSDPKLAYTLLVHEITGIFPETPKSMEDLYRQERSFLDSYKAIPLLCIPRAYAVSDKLRDLRIDLRLQLDLANSWVEERK